MHTAPQVDCSRHEKPGRIAREKQMRSLPTGARQTDRRCRHFATPVGALPSGSSAKPTESSARDRGKSPIQDKEQRCPVLGRQDAGFGEESAEIPAATEAGSCVPIGKRGRPRRMRVPLTGGLPDEVFRAAVPKSRSELTGLYDLTRQGIAKEHFSIGSDPMKFAFGG